MKYSQISLNPHDAFVFLLPLLFTGFIGAAAESFPPVEAVELPDSHQILLREGNTRILQYNYRTIEPGELLNKVTAANRIYARARSDYIHPVYGPQGEELTYDWPIDHPHHRGIYWAWPEVTYGQDMGDLHALQKVFARPTGKIQLNSGQKFAEIRAENEWRWEDRDPIVRENVVIRAYRATPEGRAIDLQFEFVGLKDGVTIARRGTDKYGGLNVRMATPVSQNIRAFTNEAGANPCRAWSDLSGTFPGASAPSGLTVLQHPENPCYPGEWVQFPELSWCQPTFPAAKTRFPLSREKPLVLRYRLWVHPGGAVSDKTATALWNAFTG